MPILPPRVQPERSSEAEAGSPFKRSLSNPDRWGKGGGVAAARSRSQKPDRAVEAMVALVSDENSPHRTESMPATIHDVVKE